MVPGLDTWQSYWPLILALIIIPIAVRVLSNRLLGSLVRKTKVKAEVLRQKKLDDVKERFNKGEISQQESDYLSSKLDPINLEKRQKRIGRKISIGLICALVVFYAFNAFTYYNVKCGQPDPFAWYSSQEYWRKCGSEYQDKGFTLGPDATSWVTTHDKTLTLPVKVVWNKGWNAEPVSATFTGDTTSVIASLTSVTNTTSSELFNLNINVPSETQTGNYVVVMKISGPEGESFLFPIGVTVQ